MRIIAGVLMAGALAFSSGCAKADWIDRTLVTVDVTGVWTGWYTTTPGGQVDVRLELQQQGPNVTGSFQTLGRSGGSGFTVSGPLEGTVAGDVFRFKVTRGSTSGELMVSGDEMNGPASTPMPSAVFLRRVDSLPRPGPR